MTNITIQLTLLRDGKTWRATAEATGAKIQVAESPSPGAAAAIAAALLEGANP